MCVLTGECLLFLVLGLVSSVSCEDIEILAGKNVSKMTYFVPIV